MKNTNINQYLKEQKAEYENIISLLEEMEEKGYSFLTYKGVSYNKRNIIGVLSRIEKRIEGAVFYAQNMDSKKWREVHRVLLEKFSEKEFEYHLELDGIHNLTQSAKATEKVIEEQGDILPAEALNALRNAVNKTRQTIQYIREENKKKWVENRFFELASTIEFEDQGKIYPLNLEKVEEIHPLDIVTNGSVDLNVLKQSGHHRNVFVDRFKEIKEEALKETLLQDELQKETV